MSIASRIRRTAASLGGAALIAGTLLATPAVAAAATGGYTCWGGVLPAGTYGSVTVAGPCVVAAGSVTVGGNLTVAGSGALLAAFDGSNVTVAGNASVEAGGVAVLGCDAHAFPCLDNPTGFTWARIGGNLSAEGALAEIVHDTAVGGNLTIDGGGGGVNCASQPALMGAPAYATFEQVTVGKNVTVNGWQSCWIGFFRNHVAGNFTYTNNITADPDGNEIQTNWIGGNMTCTGNSPAPQQGDSHGLPNVVLGKALGQCAGLTQ